MARRRIGMKALKRVIELHELTESSNRQISTATGVSRPVVAEYLGAYARCGLSWDEFSKLSDSEAGERLAAPRDGQDPRLAAALGFFPYMLKELPRVGVTREILWKEYRAGNPGGFEYSQFCHHFRSWCRAETEVTLTMEHKAGDRMYVDFAGAKRRYRENGVEREAELFVAILGASQYTYVEALRYEYTSFRTATVGFNYHIEVREDRHFYSVPFAYARKQVEVAITARTVEIYHDNQRIAFHKRAHGPGYTTAAEHRPAHHRFHLEWTPERIISWAGETSVHTRSLVKAVLERAAYPDQAYRSCVGIINLSRKYPVERLDIACRMALAEGVHSYQAVKKILEKGQDLIEASDDKDQRVLPFHENLRGQAAYQ